MRRARLAILGLALAAAVPMVMQASEIRLGWIARQPLLPTRFDHKFHKTVACTTCHHNFGKRSLGPQRCLDCHKAWGTTEARRIDTVFHAFCTGCHAERRSAGEKAGPVKACAACHVSRRG